MAVTMGLGLSAGIGVFLFGGLTGYVVRLWQEARDAERFAATVLAWERARRVEGLPAGTATVHVVPPPAGKETEDR